MKPLTPFGNGNLSHRKEKHHGKCWCSVVQTWSQLERLEEKLEWFKT